MEVNNPNPVSGGGAPSQKPPKQEEKKSLWGRTWLYGANSINLLGEFIWKAPASAKKESDKLNFNATQKTEQTKPQTTPQEIETTLRQVEAFLGKGTIDAPLKQELIAAFEDPEALKAFNDFLKNCNACYARNLDLLQQNQEMDPAKNSWMQVVVGNYFPLIGLMNAQMGGALSSLLTGMFVRSGAEFNAQILTDTFVLSTVPDKYQKIDQLPILNDNSKARRHLNTLISFQEKIQEYPWKTQIYIKEGMFERERAWIGIKIDPEFPLVDENTKRQSFSKVRFKISQGIPGEDLHSITLSLDLSALKGKFSSEDLFSAVTFITEYVEKTDLAKAATWADEQAIAQKFPELKAIALDFRSRARLSLAKLYLSVGNPNAKFPEVHDEFKLYQIKIRKLAIEKTKEVLGEKDLSSSLVVSLGKVLEDKETLEAYNKFLAACETLDRKQGLETIEEKNKLTEDSENILIAQHELMQKLAGSEDEVGVEGMEEISILVETIVRKVFQEKAK